MQSRYLSKITQLAHSRANTMPSSLFSEPVASSCTVWFSTFCGLHIMIIWKKILQKNVWCRIHGENEHLCLHSEITDYYEKVKKRTGVGVGAPNWRWNYGCFLFFSFCLSLLVFSFFFFSFFPVMNINCS